MNPLWNVELDLLAKFKEICEKYHLRYCASAGTLLGAVRHHGFIPWDDDIDLFLPWPDYKKLLEVAPAECQYPYFFQSFLTEKDGETGASRLRRSDTTGFTKWESENVGSDYDKGIFIDIFPLFYVPESETDRSIQKEAILFFWKCIRGHDALMQMERGSTSKKEYAQYIPYFKSVCKSMTITEMKWAYLNACAMPEEKTGIVGATSFRVHLPTMMWDAEWYDSYVELPFETTTILCPHQYEKVLEKQYGDWRTPVENGALHEMVAVSVDTPWREYVLSQAH